MTKPFEISKQEVWQAYLTVRRNKGAAGIDQQSMEDFDADLRNNLYKIWNRMSSGSYYPPPVLRVEIPKGDGGVRPLGIPTVADRIAQTVVRARLEPIADPHFHEDSYGYRPGKSALDAIGKARDRAWRDNWVVDLDIKGFFDSLDHSLVLRAVKRFTDCKWILLYVERWMKSDVKLPDGRLSAVHTGTPQGGVISPLLANIFLHLAFDKWMQGNYPHIHFERYADDIVVHCRSHAQAEFISKKIRDRLRQCKLEINEEKSKIVYCKDSRRTGDYSTTSFDFLGYPFRPRSSRNNRGQLFVSFSPAVSKTAAKRMRASLRTNPALRQCSLFSLEQLARAINPIIQGWINYYGRFRRSALGPIFSAINDRITKWAMRKYKHLRARKTRAGRWLRMIARKEPRLFAHWRVWGWMAG